MAGSTKIFEGVLTDLPTPILPKVFRKLMSEDPIKLRRMLISKSVFVASKIGLGCYRHLTLTMCTEDYFT